LLYPLSYGGVLLAVELQFNLAKRANKTGIMALVELRMKRGATRARGNAAGNVGLFPRLRCKA
jgi:hypothetical protein